MMALWCAACTPTPPPIDPADDVAERLAQALLTSAGATTVDGLRDGLAGAYIGDALTRQVRARAALLRGRQATGAALRLDSVEVERARWLGGAPPEAEMELHWRMAGAVTHAGHTHPRHLRAAARITAVQTPEGWRITHEQPIDVVALPAAGVPARAEPMTPPTSPPAR